MPSLPPTTSSYANKIVIAMSTAPTVPTAPTLSELNAGEFIMCHVYGDFLVQPNQETVDGQRKACSKTTPKKLGAVTYDVNDVQYSYVPQEMGTPGAPGNEVIELLAEGKEMWFAEAPGLDGETSALVAGDVVNLYHLETGVQRRGQTGDGEGDDFSVTQSFILVDGSEPRYDYVCPAT